MSFINVSAAWCQVQVQIVKLNSYKPDLKYDILLPKYLMMEADFFEVINLMQLS